MGLNLVPNAITGTVNGINVNNDIISAQAVYSAVDTNGFVIITGDLLLRNSGTLGLSDIRTGRAVKLYRNATEIPVLGSLWIEGYELDERREVLTLKLTCLLGLNNSNELGRSLICQQPQQSMNASVAIGLILDGLDIPNTIPTITGQVRDIQLSRGNTSAIQVAGSIAFSNNGFLYSDRAGIVRFATFDYPATAHVTETEPTLYRFTKEYSTELPASRYQLSTADPQLDQIDLNETDTVTTAEGTLTETKDIIPNTRRIIYESISTGAGNLYASGSGVLLEKRRIEETYETDKDLNRDGCTYDDPGRLIRRVTEVRKAFGIAYEQFITTRLKYELDNPGSSTIYSYGAETLVSRLTETWVYNYSEPDGQPVVIDVIGGGSPGGLNLSGNYIQYRRQKIGTLGVSAPWAGHKKLGRTAEAGEVDYNPAQGIYEEDIVKTWTRSKNRKQWSSREVIYQTDLLNDPSAAQEFAVSSPVALGSVIPTLTVRKLRSNRAEQNTTPEEPARFPSQYSLTNKPLLFRLNTANTGSLRRTVTYTVDPNRFSGYSTTKTLLKNLSALDWGRANAYSVSSDADRLDLAVRPLSRSTVSAESNAYEFYVDSLAVYIEPDAFIYAYNGLLKSLNGVGTIDLSASTSANDINSPTDYNPPVLFGIVSPDDEFIAVVY